MNVYAEVGQSLQQIGGTCPEGWVLMSGQRPESLMVATATGTWVAPPPVVPTSVTPFQGLAELDAEGHLEAVEAHFSDQATPLLYRLAYARAISWERGSPTTAYMAGVMGWDDAYVDQLFISAATRQS